MEASSYTKPAGVYSDRPESFKPEKKERLLAKICKKNQKQLYQSESCQKSFKGKNIGIELTGKLVAQGQDPAVYLILSYLNWFELALLLTMTACPWTKKALACRAARKIHDILVKNSKLATDEGEIFLTTSNPSDQTILSNDINKTAIFWKGGEGKKVYAKSKTG